MSRIIKYILQFLLGEDNAALADQIEYAKCSDAPVVIIPSSFFDEDIYMRPDSMPHLPLREMEGVPLLYGSPQVVQKGRQVIVYADIIASTYFLITRYEEYMNQMDRDPYGRFQGTCSLPYRAGFLMRPVVDEYAGLLRGWLKKAGICIMEPRASFQHIYLTHDIDEIWQWDNLYRALRTFAKRLVCQKQNICESFRAWYDYEKYDKIYTFSWLTDMDQCMEQCIGEKCTSVYFFKGGGRKDFSENLYYKRTRRVRKLAEYLRKQHAVLGMHASLSAGFTPQETKSEKDRLERILGIRITWNRNHYLCSRKPEDMEYLVNAGITDDFTMGYADTAGFRLGTCRPVRWINPVTKKLTDLVLHPLTVMECTLDSEMYMNLGEEEAFDVIRRMLDRIWEHNGEVVLLWHNTSVAESDQGYQRRLYERTLGFIKKKIIHKNTFE